MEYANRIINLRFLKKAFQYASQRRGKEMAHNPQVSNNHINKRRSEVISEPRKAGERSGAIMPRQPLGILT
jgi:hypothetical protein